MDKNEIIKLVDKHTLWYDSIGRQIIDENGVEDLKDELVKLFAIPVVVQQSEPFSCYEIWRPNIPNDGCKTQCKECNEKQDNGC